MQLQEVLFDLLPQYLITIIANLGVRQPCLVWNTEGGSLKYSFGNACLDSVFRVAFDNSHLATFGLRRACHGSMCSFCGGGEETHTKVTACCGVLSPLRSERIMATS